MGSLGSVKPLSTTIGTTPAHSTHVRSSHNTLSGRTVTTGAQLAPEAIATRAQAQLALQQLNQTKNRIPNATKETPEGENREIENIEKQILQHQETIQACDAIIKSQTTANRATLQKNRVGLSGFLIETGWKIPFNDKFIISNISTTDKQALLKTINSLKDNIENHPDQYPGDINRQEFSQKADALLQQINQLPDASEQVQSTADQAVSTPVNTRLHNIASSIHEAFSSLIQLLKNKLSKKDTDNLIKTEQEAVTEPNEQNLSNLQKALETCKNTLGKIPKNIAEFFQTIFNKIAQGKQELAKHASENISQPPLSNDNTADTTKGAGNATMNSPTTANLAALQASREDLSNLLLNSRNLHLISQMNNIVTIGDTSTTDKQALRNAIDSIKGQITNHPELYTNHELNDQIFEQADALLDQIKQLPDASEPSPHAPSEQVQNATPSVSTPVNTDYTISPHQHLPQADDPQASTSQINET